MYTVILHMGNCEEINRYRFWLQELEDTGRGKLMQYSSMEEAVANGIVQVARGRKSWALMIVNPGQCWTAIRDFLDQIRTVVHREKDYLVHMPEKVWLVVKRYTDPEQAALNDHISLTQLPAYCRLLEYVADSRDTEKWTENLKLLCILLLVALYEIPSENLVVYQRHRVDVELDVPCLAKYIRKYKAALYQGMNQARQENDRIFQESIEHNMEAVQDIPAAITIPEFTAQYEDKQRKKREDRDKAYYAMMLGLKREQSFLHREVLEGERYLYAAEQKLSVEDRRTVLENKQRDEIEMLKTAINQKNDENALETTRRDAERKSTAARQLRWGMGECVRSGIYAFAAAACLCMAAIWELNAFSVLEEKDKCGIIRVSAWFAIYVCMVMIGQNLRLRWSSRIALRKASKSMKLFMVRSRRNFREFALLCCRIRRKQTILRGHRLAEIKGEIRQKKVREQYFSCKNRFREMEELESFLGEMGVGLCVEDADDSRGKNAYSFFAPDNERQIPIGQSGKTMPCPFSFIKRFTIERDFIR